MPSTLCVMYFSILHLQFASEPARPLGLKLSDSLQLCEMYYVCAFVYQKSGDSTAELSEDQRQRVKRLVTETLEKSLNEETTEVT